MTEAPEEFRIGANPYPDWPRGMPVKLAALYVGMSPSLMLAEAAAGRFPAAQHISAGRIAWDRLDLDSWWDRISGRSAGTESDWLA